MELAELCQRLDTSFTDVILREGLSEQPDSRAFGAYVEQAIKLRWQDLCTSWGVNAQPLPGRRTIYDAAFDWDGHFVGVDFKSKDLHEDRYSDGGVCSVGNLLKLLTSGARFLITELGYEVRAGQAEFAYVYSVPFHVLPEGIYRIENLGTGQVRLNQSLRECRETIEWERTIEHFLKGFCKIAIDHYLRVGADADRRAATIQRFVQSGFEDLGRL